MNQAPKRHPRVSICLPNLNNRSYLPDRIRTIRSQSFTDWELVVVDYCSEDGAYEYLLSEADGEPRMQVSQAPPQGLYNNWNHCIAQAKGEYVYIATSDDTMAPDCIEKMVDALDRNPTCGIACCCLQFIDVHGNPYQDEQWENWPSVAFFGDQIKSAHIRPRYHDAVLSFALRTPYFSMTQLLIKKELLVEVGGFSNRWGSIGDLEWQMRATQLTSTVHLPEHLATWRIHPEQATRKGKGYAAVREGLMVEMADSAISFSRTLAPPTSIHLPLRLRRFYLLEQIQAVWGSLPSYRVKISYIARSLFQEPKTTTRFILWIVSRRLGVERNLFGQVRRELRRLGIVTPYEVA